MFSQYLPNLNPIHLHQNFLQHNSKKNSTKTCDTYFLDKQPTNILRILPTDCRSICFERHFHRDISRRILLEHILKSGYRPHEFYVTLKSWTLTFFYHMGPYSDSIRILENTEKSLSKTSPYVFIFRGSLTVQHVLSKHLSGTQKVLA